MTKKNIIIQDKNPSQSILDLFMKSDLIKFKIINPNPEDMEKIRYLYELGVIIGYTNEYGFLEKVSGKMDLRSRLVKW